MRHALFGVVLVCLFPTGGVAALTERVSVSSDGQQGLDSSRRPAMSADGRFVAFESLSPELVSGDTNDTKDVFVHDRDTGTTERVSKSTTGVGGNANSWSPVISADGRFVAFQSWADNLVADDTNEAADVFVHDRVLESTELVSLEPSGTQLSGYCQDPMISEDGRYVAFIAWEEGWEASRVLLRDRESGSTQILSIPQAKWGLAMSGDGRFIAFVSEDSDIVGDDTNDHEDVFVYDLQETTIERVSVASSGEEANGISRHPAISADGRYVAFQSRAINLTAGDANRNGDDVFVHDRVTGITECVSINNSGEISSWHSWKPSVSADGRYVAFGSWGTNLVPGDTNEAFDIFVHDRLTGTTERVNVSSGGGQAEGETDIGQQPQISASGQFVAFESDASNLVAWDTNGYSDVFVHDWQTASTFADVPPDQWAWAEVEACYEAGIASGYDEGLYHPEWSVTRAQMAAYISRALARGDANVPSPPPSAPPSFSDVPPSHWAYKYVEYAVGERVVAGYDDGSFRPDDTVSRAQMAVFIARAMYLIDIEDDMTSAPDLFVDVPAGHWAVTAIAACLEADVVKGYPRDYYVPDAVVTRDQMAVFMVRAFSLPL